MLTQFAALQGSDHEGESWRYQSDSFNIQISHGLVRDIAHRHNKVIQRADGYGYSTVAKTDATGAPPKAGTLACSALYLPGLNGVSRAF